MLVTLIIVALIIIAAVTLAMVEVVTGEGVEQNHSKQEEAGKTTSKSVAKTIDLWAEDSFTLEGDGSD